MPFLNIDSTKRESGMSRKTGKTPAPICFLCVPLLRILASRFTGRSRAVRMACTLNWSVDWSCNRLLKQASGSTNRQTDRQTLRQINLAAKYNLLFVIQSCWDLLLSREILNKIFEINHTTDLKYVYKCILKKNHRSKIKQTNRGLMLMKWKLFQHLWPFGQSTNQNQDIGFLLLQRFMFTIIYITIH
jgi:hypothetical protein